MFLIKFNNFQNFKVHSVFIVWGSFHNFLIGCIEITAQLTGEIYGLLNVIFILCFIVCLH